MPASFPSFQQVTYLASRAWRILVSPATPWYIKLLMLGGLIYCASPYDLIPEWVPVVGVLDDLALAALIISLALKMVPEDRSGGQ